MKKTYLFCRLFFNLFLLSSDKATIFNSFKSNAIKYNFFSPKKHLITDTIILIRFFSHNDRFETSALMIWHDVCVNTNKDNKKAQEELRSIINHFKTFEDINQCQQFILSILSYNRIVLIFSGQLCRKLVPQTHQFQQLSSIYVYCMNKEINEQ